MKGFSKVISLAMIVEALAQAAGILAMESFDLVGSGKLVYFMAIDGAKFRRPVEPGCLLSLNVEFVQKRPRVCKFAGQAMIGDKLAAEANFTAMIRKPHYTKESCAFGKRRVMRRFLPKKSLTDWSETSPSWSRK